LSSRCCAAQHTYHSRAARKKLALTGKKRKQRFFVRFLRNVQTVPCLRRQHFPNSFRNSEIGRLREQAACRDSRERLRREGGIEQHAKIGRAHVELQSRENLVCRLLLEK